MCAGYQHHPADGICMGLCRNRPLALPTSADRYIHQQCTQDLYILPEKPTRQTIGIKQLHYLFVTAGYLVQLRGSYSSPLMASPLSRTAAMLSRAPGKQ